MNKERKSKCILNKEENRKEKSDKTLLTKKLNDLGNIIKKLKGTADKINISIRLYLAKSGECVVHVNI